ncbi:hypothetical protein [Rhizobium sp. BK176]|uniref:hypothetical protein n=1 Tax=Rhizobium sp. BK176 TaxID=2587071 RepID=UPI0021678017|nr:hypothetical protein [Rhizobium sp. BK176]MCS4088515.1 hypothetical protein [Rhizobium sp. BK176]
MRTETFLETFEIDVPELKDVDMPVALTFQSHYGHPSVFRHHNGTFLSEGINPGGVLAKEFVPHEGNPAAKGIATELMASVDERTQAIEQELQKFFRTPNFEADRKPSAFHVKDWYSGTRGRALAKAQRFAEGLVVFDGRLWFPIEEPKLGVSRDVQPFLSVITNRVDHASRVNALWGHPARTPVFNINALADADAYCEAHVGDVMQNFNRASLDIRIPEAFVFDRARHAIERAAMDVLEVVASTIRDQQDEIVGRWLEARRVFERGDRSDAGWEEEVVRSVEGLLPYIRSIEKRREIAGILEVWSESTISLDLADRRKLTP